MSKLDDIHFPSVNTLSAPIVQSLIDNAVDLRLGVSKLSNGTTVIDAGIKARGGLEAGRLISEICLGGLGKVKLRATSNYDKWSWNVDIYTSHPVISCLASQYAGWKLSHGEGNGAFNALGSGPGRALGSKEELFQELGYEDKAESACLVIETSSIPPVEIADNIAKMCGIPPFKLTLILTPTSSLCGVVQIVARVLETALHKAHALGYCISDVIDGAGSSPICPPSNDVMTAMSRTNDAILFAGQVHLFVDMSDDEAEQLAKKLPSSTSSDYGKPFGEVFKDVGYDFYKIDPMLFSPAKVAVTAMESGNTFHAGNVNMSLLDKSFSNKCG